MSTDNSKDLHTLFFSKDVKLIEKRLHQLEKDHELEKLLDTVLKICKKYKANYELLPCMIPFIRKYFSTIPSTRAKSIADELIGQCNAEHSVRASSSLLRHLTETVQLGNALRFRDLVKTSVITLHNKIREKKENVEAADDLIITLFEILMFELNMQDNIEPQKLKDVWLELVEVDDSPVYYLATFIFYSSLGFKKDAVDAEIQLCKFGTLNNQKFIEFCEPHLHIPLILFEVADARIFLERLLEYYLINEKISHFCNLLFNVPELRNSCLPSIEVSSLFPSLLLKIWQGCWDKSATRMTDSDKLRLTKFNNLMELISSVRQDADGLERNAELFQEVFVKCTSLFTGYIFTKDMKAAAFSFAVTAMFDILPSLSLNTKLLLVGVMPFALAVPTTEEKTAELQRAYAMLLKDIPSDHFDKLFTDHECVNNFLFNLIKLSAKESIQLRQSCSKIVAHFLHSDWTFLSALVKRCSDKRIDDKNAYKSLLLVFSKAILGCNGTPRSDTVICFQAWLNVYQLEADSLKAKKFSPKKGLSKLHETLSTILQMQNCLPKNLSSQGSNQIIFDILLIFIQTNRLCLLAEVEVEQNQKLFQKLLDYYLLTDNFGCFPETERSTSLNRFVDTVLLNGFACGLKNYFAVVERLMKVSDISNSDDLIVTIVKSLDETGVKALKEQILQKYTVEKLSADTETRNAIFGVLFALLQTRYSSTFNEMEDYFYELFADIDSLSSGGMKFLTSYMDVIRGSKSFAEFLSLAIFTASNILGSQKFIPQSIAILAEIKRSLAVTGLIRYVVDLPEKLSILVDQFPIIGRLISKLIESLLKFRHLLIEISGNEKYVINDPIFIESSAAYDHFWKQLSNLTKQLVASKNPIITRQLPFVISNCLTGEREGNLPSYNLLSGCDEASLSLMSTALPIIEQRRFGVMFPSFVESHRFTG